VFLFFFVLVSLLLLIGIKMMQERLTIKDWAFEDRPREKLTVLGKRMMSDAELLAILIGSGTREETAVELSKRILHYLDNSIEKLAGLSVKELSKFKGIGEAKAILIIAALEFSYRRANKEVDEFVHIRCSQDIYAHMIRYFKGLKHEEFWIVLLNRGNKVILTHQLSKGGQAGTIADPKILFQIALEHHAAAVLLCHNHPSGGLKPSEQDLNLTKRVCQVGRMLNMDVLDHLIISDLGYFSFADEGLL
jgi:DNA repair protein RadC